MDSLRLWEHQLSTVDLYLQANLLLRPSDIGSMDAENRRCRSEKRKGPDTGSVWCAERVPKTYTRL